MGIAAGLDQYNSDWGGMVRVGNRVYVPEFVQPSSQVDVANRGTLHVHVFEIPGGN
jgi:hypothetical protein